MLGRTPEEIEAAERRRERSRLMRLAYPASLLRWNPDTAHNLIARLLNGPEPRPSKWSEPWRGLERLAWWSWQVRLGLQRQRRRLVGAA